MTNSQCQNRFGGVLTHTLFVANDNDFVPAVAGDNKFYVVGVTDADLASIGATFTAQQISPVPEPSTYLMLLVGLVILGLVAQQRNASSK